MIRGALALTGLGLGAGCCVAAFGYRNYPLAVVLGGLGAIALWISYGPHDRGAQ